MKKNIKNVKKAILFGVIFLIGATLLSPAKSAGDEKDLAADLLRGGIGYSTVLYDNTNGLPTSEANAIAQTAEGFLWIGSYGGLIRYDGNTFERVSSSMGISSVVDLFVDSADRLWVGTNDSGAAVIENGKTKTFNKSDGLRSLYVCTVTEQDGVIYIGTTQGIAAVGQDMKLRLIDEPQINNEYVQELRAGADGMLYGRTKEGAVFTMKDGKLAAFYDGAAAGIPGIHCVVPDDSAPGCVYIGTTGSDVYYGKLSDGLEKLKKYDISPLEYVNQIYRNGEEIWYCTDKGIGLVQGETFTYLEDLPFHSSVECMVTDYQGNLWFASSKQGVMKIIPNQFTDIFEEYGLEADVVATTCIYRDMFFIGRKSQGLAVLQKNGPVDALPLVDAVTAAGQPVGAKDLFELTKGSQIRSILRDSKGNLWLSVYGKYPLIRYDGTRAVCFTTADGMPSERVRAICERGDGSIMVACTGGMALIRKDTVETVYNENSGISNAEILTVAEMQNGDMLVGSDGNGIYVISGKKVTHLGIDDGLASEVVLRMKRDVSRDIVWIVTSNSIAYMDASYHVTTIKNFPYANNFDLYENSRGEMWILSSNGIYVASVEELLTGGEISALLYNRHNGLPCIATANSYSELTASGELYVAGTTGVAKVNIEVPFEGVENIKMAVPFLEADGEMLYPDKDGVFTVGAKVKKLTIHDFVFTYSLLNPQVRYLLEGFESDAVTLRRSELAPVDYTNLAGGEYRFVMKLVDGRGEEKNELAVRIVKQKAIHEQIWFPVVCVILGILLVALAVMLFYRGKTRRLLQKSNEQKEFIKEVTEVLAKTIDMKDKYTNGHSSRVAKYTAMLAEELGYDRETIDRYYNIALLHDIGKISVPGEVLNKNGKLTDEEFTTIKSHTTLGGETLRQISIMPELAIGAQSHHERPDGKGYPEGLRGGEIPRVAQIIAVADAFDAMYSDRPYRKRMNFDKVVSIMQEVSGTQLTPDVVDAFMRLVKKGEMRDKNDTGGGTTENIDNIRKDTVSKGE